MSRLAAALVALVAIASILAEVSLREADTPDECLHAGAPTECTPEAHSHNHR